MRAIIVAMALTLSATSVAHARDFMTIGARTYTFDELAGVPAPSVGDVLRKAPHELPDRRYMALVNAKKTMLRELPAALGMSCDVAVSQADIENYARWWDQRAALMYDRATPAPPNSSSPAPRGAARFPALQLHHDPKDPQVEAQAREVVSGMKHLACVARMYPASPFGEGAVFAAPDGAENFAPIAFDSVASPYHPCLNVEPLGAIWDMVRAAEDKGILTVHDGATRYQLSSRRRPRPNGFRYLAASCLETPPWSVDRAG